MDLDLGAVVIYLYAEYGSPPTSATIAAHTAG
jgi:hypothetical protein